MFIFLGCGNWSNKVATDKSTYTFLMTTITSDFEEIKTIEVPLPKRGKKKKIYPQNGEIYVEYQISYPDNSTFYITNDIWNGSRLNVDNLIEIGINGHTKESLLDTVSYQGGENQFWKEQFLGEIVVGYVNASPSKKEAFENAIASINKKEK